MNIDFGKILKRAWHVLWNYKILWIFGILLALTASRGNSSIGSGSGWRFGSDDLPRWNTDLSLDPQFSLRSGELTEWYAAEYCSAG